MPVSTSPASPLRHIVPNQRFKVTDGLVTFIVEDVSFSAHRFFFERESAFFRNLFATRANSKNEDSDTFALHEASPTSFADFLSVFYSPTYDQYNITQDSWLEILRLANRWEFPNIKDLAVRHLEMLEIEDVTLIRAYQEFGVHMKHVLRHLATLVGRLEPLSDDEGETLGLKTALRVACAREKVRAKLNTNIISAENNDLRKVLLDVFVPSSAKKNDKKTEGNEKSSSESTGVNGKDREDKTKSK